MTDISIQVGDPYTFGTRLSLLRRMAGSIGQERLSEEIGERKGLVSWYEALGSDNAPKAVNAGHAWKLATALAGRGRVTSDAQAVFRFLLGIDNDAAAIDQGVRENNNSQRFTDFTLTPYLPKSYSPSFVQELAGRN